MRKAPSRVRSLRHEGYAERARDGVLLLDEIAELPPNLQAKLLRMTQERRFFRVGGEQPLEFKARLICATNAELEKEVESGRFRRDLYYRINVISIKIPPLRERREDIAALLDGYVAQFAEAFRAEVRGASTLAEEVALVYHWPGNVRELRNRAERAVALAQGPWLGPADIFPDLVPQALLSDTARRGSPPGGRARRGGAAPYWLCPRTDRRSDEAGCRFAWCFADDPVGEDAAAWTA